MNLSSHFTLSEFTASQTAERDLIDNDPPVDVIERLKHTAMGLEGVRTVLGTPIIISSGYRSLALNRAIGSNDTSQHITGEAVDFTAPGFGKPRQVMEKIIASGLYFDQCILEFASRGNGWVHMSFVEGKGRHQALVIDHDGTRVWA